MSKKNILNLFPKPENLTEVSILSAYEILLYLLIFFACFWIYKSWTTIPVRTIEFECERIDTVKQYCLVENNGEKNYKEKYNDKYDKVPIKTIGYINVDIPNSIAIYDSTMEKEQISTYYKREFIAPFTIVPDSYGCFYFVYGRELYKKRIDSLYYIYNEGKEKCSKKYAVRPEFDSELAFYQKLTVKSNLFRIYHPFEKQYDSIQETRDAYGFHRYFYKVNCTNGLKHPQIGGNVESVYESYVNEEFPIYITGHRGIFDIPNKLDNYDISQCYYRFKIKTLTLDTVKLCLHFQGANEFIYVKNKPVKVVGQDLTYNITGYLNSDRNDIILHVKSKELENIQNSRIFIITAILSGLIVIFLTFSIIFIYRLGHYIRLRKKGEKTNQKEIVETDIITDEVVSNEISKDDESPNEEQVEQKNCEEISVNKGEKEDIDKSTNNSEKVSSKREKK